MAAMNQPGGPSTAVSVLQGYNFAATGKIANVTPVAIWPEATPFIRHMNTPESDSATLRSSLTFYCGGTTWCRRKMAATSGSSSRRTSISLGPRTSWTASPIGTTGPEPLDVTHSAGSRSPTILG